MSEALERACRVAVWGVNGIGPATFEKLMDAFGSGRAIWEAEATALSEVLNADVCGTFLTAREMVEPEKKVADLRELGITVVCLGMDEAYPKHLANIRKPPPILFVRGELLAQDELAVAVVGTRRPTGYGVQVTKRLVQELVAAGVTIVSGMARGIDGVAHKAALEAGGRTIAVVAHGLDMVYPAEHKTLSKRIIEDGAVITGFNLGEQPLRGNFVARNRFVAGMSRGVLVTEGAQKSGTKHTAGFAMKQEKPVWAVPGPITSQMSAAPVGLLKEGAEVVTSGEDILTALGLGGGVSKKQVTPDFTDTLHKQVWELLSQGEIAVDDLVRELQVSAQELSVALTMMEMNAWIVRRGRMVSRA